ncbi:MULTISPECIES: SpoIIE family protein phosphatase [unclassified Ruminococcus]|uniref:SpoIIE family protein phosphatase n=1 Tax=unclassified Ruminococcus TaxID=2608920 RepID=UPI00210AFD21|nr:MULTISPECIES: SpoIIE family protein phosphatase [unclassified Ruminococcus]
MKIQRTATAGDFIRAKTKSKNVRAVITQIAYFISGFIVSAGAVFGSYAPFGGSLVAAVPSGYLISVTSGTIFGYIIMTPSGSFRYVATVLAIGAIRWTFSDLTRVNSMRLYAPAVAFVPMLATGLVLAAVGDFQLKLVFMCIIEAALAAVAAYFFSRTIKLSFGTRGLANLNQQEIACIVMTLCILLLSCSSLQLAGISIGRIIAVSAVLICAKYGAVAGGCISGVSTGVVFSLSDSSLSFLGGAYAFGGLLAGLFAPTGKIGCLLAFFVCSTVMAFQSGDMTVVLGTIYETAIAGAIFLLLPRDLGNTLSAVFAPPTDKTHSEGLRRSVIMRLDFAAQALCDVSSAVDTVAEKMKKLFSADPSRVYSNSAEEICSNCGLRVFCWEKQKQTTLSDFQSLTPALKKNGKISEKDFSVRFAKKCCKSREMAQSINKNYEAYLAYLSAERRVGEVRAVVAGQFSGLSEILGEMAEEFKSFERFDSACSERVSCALKEEGIAPIDVSCRIDRFGRMAVEIETVDFHSSNVKNAVLSKAVSRACGRHFDAPCISLAPNRCKIQMSERASYDVEIGSCQHISNDGTLCGDSFNYFSDGLGRLVAVISDGMGTGGRAAVDGSMAESIMSKLIKAGLGYDCALSVVNSALMVKSGDESLATLDIASIDLFTGDCELLKAGAPLTFVKKNGKALRYNSTSLPAGILTDIKFSHERLNLNPDDRVVMLSDGAVATGDTWLEGMIENWDKESAQDFAKSVVAEARLRRTDGYDDDITVIAMRLIENEEDS